MKSYQPLPWQVMQVRWLYLPSRVRNETAFVMRIGRQCSFDRRKTMAKKPKIICLLREYDSAIAVVLFVPFREYFSKRNNLCFQSGRRSSNLRTVSLSWRSVVNLRDSMAFGMGLDWMDGWCVKEEEQISLRIIQGATAQTWSTSWKFSWSELSYWDSKDFKYVCISQRK